MKEIDYVKLNKIFNYISDEFQKATKTFGKFSSVHEGYAILLEEVDELWDEIKNKDSSMDKIKEEALHVAAMAIRLIYDGCEV